MEKSAKSINIDQVDDDIESVDQKAETALADFEDMDRWETLDISDIGYWW